jgi:hypothetical protein
MKNTLILIFISVSISLFIYYMNGCSDKTTNPPNTPECKADTTILLTDEFGNVLGGDTTDWCLHDSGGVTFGPAYPNPSFTVFRLRYYIPAIDTIKIYLLKTCSDTATYFEGKVNPGQYEIQVNDSLGQYKNTYQRIYFKSKHFSASPYCRFYGDVKFTN